MSDAEEDEQLKEAIALSLQSARSSGNGDTNRDDAGAPPGVIDLTESPPVQKTESEDGDGLKRPSTGTVSHSTDQTRGYGIPGLDRRKMEAERLARKRKLSISPPPARRKKHTPSGSDIESSNTVLDSPLQPGSGVLLYPKGAVKKTWAFGFPRGDDVKIEEVLQRGDLQLAVLSSYQWDVEWLMRKISLEKTKMIFVMEAKDDAVVSS